MSSPDDADAPLDPLTQIAIRHGTDKWGPHFYTPVYHELFSHLRDKPVRLLEIGIGGYYLRTVGGASLAMWAEYFPQGRIVGIDITPKALALGPRVTTLAGSQNDVRFLKEVCDRHGPFDIVIDDGSHVPTDVATSFYALFPLLADRGYYVIEDVQTAFWPQFGGSALDGGATMKIATRMLEFLNHAEIKIVQPTMQLAAYATQVKSLRAFHNIIVVEKGDNTEPSNFDYKLGNPHAARAVKTIKAAIARAPTAEAYANLIEIHGLAGDLAAAQALVQEGLTKWPDCPALLQAGSSVAEARGDHRSNLEYLQRLAKIEPQNATLIGLCEAAKAKLARSHG